MTKPLKNQQAGHARTTPAQSPAAQSVPEIPSASNIPVKGLAGHMKAWAWRLTAAYLWVHSILTVFAGRDLLAQLETATTTRVIGFLSHLSFAPVNAGHLRLVFVLTWLLSITEFSPIQLLIGFPLYVIVFPFTVLIRLIFRRALKAAPAGQSVFEDAPKLKKGLPLASCSAAFLVGWLLLYGGSSSRGPLLVGFALSGALFLTLAYRALDKTSRLDEQDTALFSGLAIRGIMVVTNAFKRAVQTPPKTNWKSQAD